MKKYIMFISMFVIFCSFSIKSKATDCYNTHTFGCTQWINVDYLSRDVILPDFPLCTLHVNYTRRCCLTDPGNCQIRIKDYNLGADCANIYQYLHPNGQLNVDPLQNKKLLNKIFKAVSEAEFLEDKLNYICPKKQKNYSLWAGSCQGVCELIFTDMTVGYVTNDCVTDFCCGIIMTYCWNDQTQSIEKTQQNVFEQAQNCYIVPAPPCPMPGQEVSGKIVQAIHSFSGCHDACIFE